MKGRMTMIYCVEDDASIRDLEVYTLCSTGFAAQGFRDSKELFEAIHKQKPELIVLDIMLPGDDGVQILHRLKNSSELSEIPVIMATAKSMEYDKIKTLDMGADDYLVKPFGMLEMVSRIKAVLRRCKTPGSNVLRAAGVTLNEDEHTVAVVGERIALTYKEYELLRLFMSKPGIAFSREQLFSEIWGMDYCGETRTLDMHIRTLRQKLGAYGKLIETVRNVGYRMSNAENAK